METCQEADTLTSPAIPGMTMADLLPLEAKGAAWRAGGWRLTPGCGASLWVLGTVGLSWPRCMGHQDPGTAPYTTS